MRNGAEPARRAVAEGLIRLSRLITGGPTRLSYDLKQQTNIFLVLFLPELPGLLLRKAANAD